MADLEHLSVLDELFLHLEGPTAHMHVGGVSLFEGPAPEHADMLDMVDLRLQEVPRFRHKLAFVPFGLGRPVWVDDPHFNLEYHVRRTALPHPGDLGRLEALAARIMSQQLDRTKPLWELWVVEGLADGRFAIVSKTHHCVVDGVSGADIMTVLLDPDPQGRNLRPQPYEPRPEPTPEELIAYAARERLTSPVEAMRTIQSLVMDPEGLPNQALRAVRAVAEWIVGGLELAPACSLNRPIGAHRRFQTLLVALDDLKTIKNALGGTVNDVVVAACTGGLRRLLAARGEPVDELELRAMIPVSVRQEPARGALGNQVACMWAPVPVLEGDPVARLRRVSAAMEDLKRSGQAVGAQVLTSLGEYAPPTIVAQASRLVARQRAFNLVITNVPGPQFPLYCLGRQMTEVYPVVPLVENTTIGIALFSYNGTVGFGLLGDYDTTADLGVLAEGIDKSVTEMLNVASG